VRVGELDREPHGLVASDRPSSCSRISRRERGRFPSDTAEPETRARNGAWNHARARCDRSRSPALCHPASIRRFTESHLEFELCRQVAALTRSTDLRIQELGELSSRPVFS
jgi:hypothetical protein